MGRFENKGRKMFDSITSVLVFIFGLIATIAFWVFISRGDVYDNWYPIFGHFTAAHGALIGITIYEYMNAKHK